MAKKRKFYKKISLKKKQLPNNSRFIPEKFLNDHIVFALGLVGILIAIFIVSYDSYRNYSLQEKVINEREEVVKNLNFWNKEVISKPNYRDGYFSLALIYFQLGDLYNSKENLDKALIIDPNFERGIEFKNYLENNY